MLGRAELRPDRTNCFGRNLNCVKSIMMQSCRSSGSLEGRLCVWQGWLRFSEDWFGVWDSWFWVSEDQFGDWGLRRLSWGWESRLSGSERACRGLVKRPFEHKGSKPARMRFGSETWFGVWYSWTGLIGLIGLQVGWFGIKEGWFWFKEG